MLKGQPLVAVSYHGEQQIGRLAFPYDKCRICMAGVYDLPLQTTENSRIEHFDMRIGLIVYAACDDYLGVHQCPYFKKIQGAMLNGRAVFLEPYEV